MKSTMFELGIDVVVDFGMHVGRARHNAFSDVLHVPCSIITCIVLICMAADLAGDHRINQPFVDATAG